MKLAVIPPPPSSILSTSFTGITILVIASLLATTGFYFRKKEENTSLPKKWIRFNQLEIGSHRFSRREERSSRTILSIHSNLKGESLIAIQAKPEKSKALHFSKYERIPLSGPDAASSSQSINLLKSQSSPSHITLAVSGRNCFVRYLELPPLSPKQINSIVGFEAAQNVPFPLAQVHWNYEIVNKKSQVRLEAINSDYPDGWITSLKKKDLNVTRLVNQTSALSNFFQYIRKETDVTSVAIFDDGRSTTIIIGDNNYAWTRIVPVSLGSDLGNEKIIPNTKRIWSEIMRTITFFKREFGALEPEEYYFVGDWNNQKKVRSEFSALSKKTLLHLDLDLLFTAEEAEIVEFFHRNPCSGAILVGIALTEFYHCPLEGNILDEKDL